MKDPIAAVWAVLILATMVSWAAGADDGLGVDSRRAASVAILVIAFVKARLIGLYFMDLRGAPPALRLVLESYCVIVCALLVGVFLVG